MYKLRFQGNTVTYGNVYVGCPDPAHLLLLNQTTGGTITADKMSGVPGEIATLSNTPDSYYTFDNYSITGATLTGSQFEFGSTDVTAEATFLPTVYNVTLQTDGHGKISASKTTGHYGDTITLGQTASAEYNFNSYQITGAVLTGSQFELTGSNVTAKATYTQKVYTLTLQTDGHGKLVASKTTGHKGDTVTLTPTHNTYYRFNNYSQTGGSISNNTFTFGSQNATAKANFTANKFTASGRWLLPYTSTGGSNSQFPITEVSLCQYKTSNTPASFLVAATATSKGGSRSTNSAWRGGACSGYKLSFAAVSHSYKYGSSTTGSCTGASYAGSTKINGVTAGGTYHWTGTVTIPAGNTTTTGLFKITFTGAAASNYFSDVNTGTTWTATGYAP